MDGKNLSKLEELYRYLIDMISRGINDIQNSGLTLETLEGGDPIVISDEQIEIVSKCYNIINDDLKYSTGYNIYIKCKKIHIYDTVVDITEMTDMINYMMGNKYYDNQTLIKNFMKINDIVIKINDAKGFLWKIMLF